MGGLGFDSELSVSSSELSREEGGEGGSDFKIFSIEKGFIGFVLGERSSVLAWSTCNNRNKYAKNENEIRV